jgi:hypothetical protein
MHRMQKWGLAVVVAGGFLASAKPVSADVRFRSGDIMDARNVTVGESAWSKSISAKVLDEIEFRVLVENLGDSESSDVNVRAGFALDPGSTLNNKIYVGVWSAPMATGTVEIKVDDDSRQKLVYVLGKSIKYGGGCDGCSVSDTIAKTPGAYVGKVKPGEKIEVRFRGQITDRQVASASTSVTPTPTPKPEATGGSAVASASPKTGFTDPIWMRTLMWLGLGIAGVGLRQVAGKMSKIEA